MATRWPKDQHKIKPKRKVLTFVINAFHQHSRHLWPSLLISMVIKTQLKWLEHKFIKYYVFLSILGVLFF